MGLGPAKPGQSCAPPASAATREAAWVAPASAAARLARCRDEPEPDANISTCPARGDGLGMAMPMLLPAVLLIAAMSDPPCLDLRGDGAVEAVTVEELPARCVLLLEWVPVPSAPGARAPADPAAVSRGCQSLLPKRLAVLRPCLLGPGVLLKAVAMKGCLLLSPLHAPELPCQDRPRSKTSARAPSDAPADSRSPRVSWPGPPRATLPGVKGCVPPALWPAVCDPRGVSMRELIWESGKAEPVQLGLARAACVTRCRTRTSAWKALSTMSASCSRVNQGRAAIPVVGSTASDVLVVVAASAT